MNNAFITILMIQSLSLSAQPDKPFNPITQQLIFNEVHQQGLTHVREKIQNAAEPKTGTKGLCWRQRTPPALTIKTTFHKNEISTNPLAQLIFDKIESIERTSGYMPQGKEIDSDHFKCATNYLGEEVRYFWLEEEGQCMSAVRVEAELTDKNKLLELIATYQD